MTNQKCVVRIPFPGFYESLLSYEIDEVLSREDDYLMETEGRSLSWNETTVNYDEIAESWLSFWFDKIKNFTALETTEEPEFKLLWHPKEYNFSTDEIDAELPLWHLKHFLDFVCEHRKEEFTRYVKEALKPCDGFTPFYSNDLRDWGHYTTWKSPQWYLLLKFISGLMEDDSGFSLEYDYLDFYNGSEIISNAVRYGAA